MSVSIKRLDGLFTEIQEIRYEIAAGLWDTEEKRKRLEEKRDRIYEKSWELEKTLVKDKLPGRDKNWLDNLLISGVIEFPLQPEGDALRQEFNVPEFKQIMMETYSDSFDNQDIANRVVEFGKAKSDQIESYFKNLWAAYEQKGTTLLDMLYLTSLPETRFLEFLEIGKQKSKKHFDELRTSLGRNPIVFDSNKILAKYYKIPVGDFPDVTKLLLGGLKIPEENIIYDIEPRLNKQSGSSCFAIRIPEDIRLILNLYAAGPGALRTILHETGHAIMYSLFDKTDPFEQRWQTPSYVNEGCAILFERLLGNSDFIEKIGLTENQEALRTYVDFLTNKTITDYASYATAELEIHKAQLTGEAADTAFKKAIQEYRGYNLDGAFWRGHPHIATRPLYSISYVGGNLIAEQMETNLTNNFGLDWFRKPEIKQYLKQNYLEPVFAELDEMAGAGVEPAASGL